MFIQKTTESQLRQTKKQVKQKQCSTNVNKQSLRQLNKDTVFFTGDLDWGKVPQYGYHPNGIEYSFEAVYTPYSWEKRGHLYDRKMEELESTKTKSKSVNWHTKSIKRYLDIMSESIPDDYIEDNNYWLKDINSCGHCNETEYMNREASLRDKAKKIENFVALKMKERTELNKYVSTSKDRSVFGFVNKTTRTRAKQAATLQLQGNKLLQTKDSLLKEANFIKETKGKGNLIDISAQNSWTSNDPVYMSLKEIHRNKEDVKWINEKYVATPYEVTKLSNIVLEAHEFKKESLEAFKSSAQKALTIEALIKDFIKKPDFVDTVMKRIVEITKVV